ncbi:MAG: ribosome assembly RNA-binding protein YhbY [Gammaproteobacteria bacterium]|nr:MAG: ribosome assembly RNA-binding protein YhbY [Gammaproteobacteria bacterium]
MKLNPKQSKYLRKLGHSMSPTVIVADKGLTENVVAAIDEALEIHELIKVKVRQPKEQRKVTNQQICEKTNSYQAQTIGMILLIYRPGKDPQISLPGPKLNHGS